MTTLYGVRPEYRTMFGREVLTLWSGPFMSVYEGEILALPKGDGYMVTLDYNRGKVRVQSETPRTEQNFHRVDAAINAAVNAADKRRTIAEIFA